MGKSYRRHHKRPKRKNTRRRRRGGAEEETLQKHYENGVKAAQPHVDKMNKMATDLHKQAYDSGKKSYKLQYCLISDAFVFRYISAIDVFSVSDKHKSFVRRLQTDVLKMDKDSNFSSWYTCNRHATIIFVNLLAAAVTA